MRLNALGRAALNSPLRSLAQVYVASKMLALGGRLHGAHVLEVGCGGGFGATLILGRFGASSLKAIDLDPKMVQRARRRLAAYPPDRVQVEVGDVTTLSSPCATFDAVFDFGAIHLERAWQAALSEVARVLKPGGKFFFELVTTPALRVTYRFMTETGSDVQPPSPDRFVQELDSRGILVGERIARPRLAALTGWVGDLVGVGVRSFPAR